MSNPPLLAVHGIGNRVAGVPPAEAARTLAQKWQPALAAGYAAAGLDEPPPSIVAAYFADLLATQAQGGPEDRPARGGVRIAGAGTA